MLTIGVIREGKVPADKRVALTPQNCLKIQQEFAVKVLVEPSEIRAIADDEYAALGIELNKDLSNCDILIGVKEVPVDLLIPNKTYLFFSHTHKKQAYNKKLLKAVLEKHITLVDYEVLTDPTYKRLIGFGRYAGIVGMYNALLAWGIKTASYNLKPAHTCFDLKEMLTELKKVKLDKHFKLVITGGGRVGGGAIEILNQVEINQVFPQEYLSKTFEGAVFTQLNVEDYNAPNDGSKFVRRDFYKDPSVYHSVFLPYAQCSDVYVPCHFWDAKAPFIFTREDAKRTDFKLKLVADISCDIDCAVASTIRPSTIQNPLYGYNPITESEVDFMDEAAIGVMAVDNLPCELPRDASADFGAELIKHIMPSLLVADTDGIIKRATIAQNGQLCKDFLYLSDFVNG